MTYSDFVEQTFSISISSSYTCNSNHMLHIKHFGYSIAYSRLLFIYTNQIRKNTLTNLRINERMHAHQLTQHNCQRLGCFPFPFGRRLFPFLTTRLMNLPKGKSTGRLLVGTPTRYITRRLGKG